MAAAQTSTVPGDEEREYLSSDDSASEQATNFGGGYGFEPVLTADQQQQRQERRRTKNCFNSALQKLISADRLLSPQQWCSCGVCSIARLRRPKECYCCNEPPANVQVRQAFSAKLGDFGCITRNPDFAKYCLDRELLRIIEMAVAEKWETLAKVDFDNNSTYRHAAYVSYTYWVYGKLGRHNRKILPACAVAKIRENFPDPDGRYVGYLSSSDHEDGETDSDDVKQQ